MMKCEVLYMNNMPQILLVDDDVALLQALPQALSLKMDNVQVDTCDSAFEALEQIQEHEYDAIVSDIKMPGMDGLALLEKIQELQPETPTLLITGFFFSSRRRHTRLTCDWSSDVCSSD